MAEVEARKNYPMLSSSHWWSLRKKFRQSIPGIVTDGYLATVFNMAAASARANILPFLKTLGLIDQDGKPTERVKLWRDDDSYPDVCKAMLKEIYPSELLDAVPDPSSDKAKAQRWFMNQKGGVGEAAARRMAGMYALLSEADPTKQPDGQQTTAPQKKVSQRTDVGKPQLVSTVDKVTENPKTMDKDTAAKRPPVTNTPEVNINLQIHISADASSDQIDQIFVSMAKHLYKNG
jgi:hypothetical protein